MEIGIQHGGRMIRKNGFRLVLAGAMLFFMLALPGQALVVTVDIGWGYNAGWTSGNAEQNLVDTYHLQEGSIVQVIMYNSANPGPGAGAAQNFRSFGTYTNTPGLDAEPIAVAGSNVPPENTIYDPYSVTNNHVIAYSTQIGGAISNAAGYWYNIYAQFEILGTYDRLYLRVFGATNFPQGIVVASFWGLSPVQEGTNLVGTWYVNPIDNVVANQTNYFEVIPEPATLTLVWLGGVGLWAGHRRRKSRGLKPGGWNPGGI